MLGWETKFDMTEVVNDSNCAVTGERARGSNNSDQLSREDLHAYTQHHIAVYKDRLQSWLALERR